MQMVTPFLWFYGQVSPTDPLEESIADGLSRVLRGAFVKA
jgi:hypothetical protein